MRLHRLDDGVERFQPSNACVGVGGGSGRVEFDAMHMGRGGGIGNCRCAGIVCQIQRHERLERLARGHVGQDTISVGQSVIDIAHRRRQIGHDNRASRPGGDIGYGNGQRRSISQVDVPVVRQCHGERGHVGATVETGAV